ncbi:MAG: hypothetical protein M1819_004250 [Sarea resinae]|nr:MAG: hypothetical protein M1819_004250 [Sarea resinae]
MATDRPKLVEELNSASLDQMILENLNAFTISKPSPRPWKTLPKPIIRTKVNEVSKAAQSGNVEPSASMATISDLSSKEAGSKYASSVALASTNLHAHLPPHQRPSRGETTQPRLAGLSQTAPAKDGSKNTRTASSIADSVEARPMTVRAEHEPLQKLAEPSMKVHLATLKTPESSEAKSAAPASFSRPATANSDSKSETAEERARRLNPAAPAFTLKENIKPGSHLVSNSFTGENSSASSPKHDLFAHSAGLNSSIHALNKGHSSSKTQLPPSTNAWHDFITSRKVPSKDASFPSSRTQSVASKDPALETTFTMEGLKDIGKDVGKGKTPDLSEQLIINRLTEDVSDKPAFAMDIKETSSALTIAAGNNATSRPTLEIDVSNAFPTAAKLSPSNNPTDTLTPMIEANKASPTASALATNIVRENPSTSKLSSPMAPTSTGQENLARVRKELPESKVGYSTTFGAWPKPQSRLLKSDPSRQTSLGAIITATPESIAAAKASKDRFNVETENELRFKAWPKPEDRETSPARIRRVTLTNLPPNSNSTLIQSLVFHGSIEAILYTAGKSSAQVFFLNPEDCKKYYDDTANGIVIKIPGMDKEHVVFVQLAEEVDVVGSLVSQLVQTGATRCVRAIGVGQEWGISELENLASQKGRKLEHVEIGKSSSGARKVTFRFCSIQDAVRFKGILARDEDWEPCNIHFSSDPCAKATAVHMN